MSVYNAGATAFLDETRPLDEIRRLCVSDWRVLKMPTSADVYRRSTVLNWYRGLPCAESAGADLASDLIWCLDDELVYAGLDMSKALGRPFYAGSFAEDPCDACADPSSILFFGSPGRFTADFTRQLSSWSARTRIPIGLAIADDQNGASYLVQKFLLAHRRTARLSDGVVNMDTGLCGRADRLEIARADQISATLAADWRALIVCAPSRLAHMSLG